MTGIADLSAHITRLVDAEIAALDPAARADAALLAEFSALRVKPSPVSVQFSGAIVQTCWMVTRSNGRYQVIYLPTAGYFSLCMNSDLGLLDMGVHGPALQCFASV